jgi:glycosyltransferase involved in cell wall biosynthesis
LENLTSHNTPKLRICHLGKYYHPFRGGIETHVQSLARAQAESGIAVTVACINHRDANGQDVGSSRAAKTPTVIESDGDVQVHRFGKLATLARFDFCRGMRQFLYETWSKYDLLHLHVPNPSMCVALAATRPKVPIVVTYHSDIVKQRFIRKPFRIIEDAVLSRVSRIIVATQAYRDSSSVLKRYHGKTAIVPFGLELDRFKTSSHRSQEFENELRAKSQGSPIWLCVGRLVYYKGTEHAIRALVDCPGRLVVVGGGELFSSLRELAESLKVADRIDWYGSLDDEQLRGAYRAATAMMFPSVVRSEAFGLVQIEAMASGCPVINTHIPGSGVPWVSLDNVSGLTVPINDPGALATAASRIASEPGLRNRLSTGAIERADQFFNIDDMTERTMNVYSTVLGRSLASFVCEPKSKDAEAVAPAIEWASYGSR